MRKTFLLVLSLAFFIVACNPESGLVVKESIVPTAAGMSPYNIIEAWSFDEGTGSVAQGTFGVLNLSVLDVNMWRADAYSYCLDGGCIIVNETLNGELQNSAIPEKINPGNYDNYTICAVVTYHDYNTSENDVIWSFGNNNHYQLDSYPHNPYLRGRFDKADGSTCYAQTSNSGFVVNQTYKICSGHNRTHNFVYVDGEQVAAWSCGDTARYNVSGYVFRIGEGAYNGNDLYGTFDSLVIFAEAPPTVAAWYNTTGYQAASWTGGVDPCAYNKHAAGETLRVYVNGSKKWVESGCPG